MLQRFPISLARVNLDNISENLLNDICQIMHFLCIEQKKLLKHI